MQKYKKILKDDYSSDPIIPELTLLFTGTSSNVRKNAQKYDDVRRKSPFDYQIKIE